MPCLRRYRVWAALFAVGAGLFGGAVAYVAADIPYLDVAEPSLRSRADGVLLGLLLISSWIAAGLAVAGAAATAWVHRRARRRRAEGGG